jgi:16S rRNA (guanine(966)-N(2))-methyltransferase RsmD
VPQSRSGTGTRPTTDRVRESLFNVLTARMELSGIAVLDLYAGSGALGIEAASRGAGSVLFVESDRRAAAVITENVVSLGVEGATVRCADVSSVVDGGARHGFSLVVADPPYEVSSVDVEGLVAALDHHGWTQPDTVVVFERPASGPPLRWPEGWTEWRERRYGDTRLEMAQRDG